jgi:hypothetical protein
MIFILAIIAVDSRSPDRKKDSKLWKGNFRDTRLKPKITDACYDDDVAISTLTDETTCPDAYVALYQALPASTKPTGALSTFATDCEATQCATTGCYNLLVKEPLPTVFDDAFLIAFRTSCAPSGAAALDIDACTKGDGSIPTSVVDQADCLEAYDALIAGLPNPAADRRLNKTFLSTPAELYSAFTTKCLKSICQKTECYKAIIKTTVAATEPTLKQTLSEKCDPHPPPENTDNDLSMFSASKLLLSFGLSLINLGFWL